MKKIENETIHSAQSSYRKIMKATSIFGGVQVIQIIITIIRSKVIAILLGPLGMGINGLLTSTLSMIRSLTNFGLGTSAVKDIAAANASQNTYRIRKTVTVFRRMVWFTGLLGSIVTLLLSSWLSKLAFGNTDYTYAFALISITLLINQLSEGQKVILRGMRKIAYMAKASLYGSIIGLFTTLPLYYLWGINGIVPGIIVTSLTALCISWYFANKIKIEKIRINKIRTYAEAKGMMSLGFMISMSGLITLGASYIFKIYISQIGGVDQVGLYTAGFAIVNGYVGMVFTAMSTDYYPRLAGVAEDNQQSKQVINQQAEIAILILSPIILTFIVFINWVVILLYSSQFTPINNMILYAILGIFFKAASWAIAYIFLAKGSSKLFFINELITNIYLLVFNIVGYTYLGMTGIGISFLIAYMIYLIQVYVISRYKYQFSFNTDFYKIFIPQLLLAISCLLIIKNINQPYSYIIGFGFISISAWLSYKGLDRRIGINSLFARFKKKVVKC